jgi:lysophospholipase L1-like esterase
MTLLLPFARPRFLSAAAAFTLAASLAGASSPTGFAAPRAAAPAGFEPIDSMAVIGDSKAVGILANTTVGAQISPAAKAQMESLGALIKQMRKKREGGGSEVNDVLKDTEDDSRSRADSWYRIGWAFAHGGLNAFTGRKPYALNQRIAAETGRRIENFNEAIAAGSADTIAIQLERIAADAAKRAPQGKVDMFVLDVGSVDFIARKPPERFARDYIEGLEAILAHNPRARILALKVADPIRLLEFPDQVAFRFLLGKENCSSVRVRLGFVDLLVEDMQNDPSGTRERLAAMNAFLETLPDWFAANAPEARLVLMDYPSVGADLMGAAADCFHPSEAGNEVLAEAALPYVRKLLAP